MAESEKKAGLAKILREQYTAVVLVKASSYAPGCCSARTNVDQRFVTISTKDQNIDTPYMKWNR